MELTRGYEDGRGCRVDCSCRSRGERHLRTSQKDEEMGPWSLIVRASGCVPLCIVSWVVCPFR
jgi:hypothetical protein